MSPLATINEIIEQNNSAVDLIDKGQNDDAILMLRQTLTQFRTRCRANFNSADACQELGDADGQCADSGHRNQDVVTDLVRLAFSACPEIQDTAEEAGQQTYPYLRGRSACSVRANGLQPTDTKSPGFVSGAFHSARSVSVSPTSFSPFPIRMGKVPRDASTEEIAYVNHALISMSIVHNVALAVHKQAIAEASIEKQRALVHKSLCLYKQVQLLAWDLKAKLDELRHARVGCDRTVDANLEQRSFFLSGFLFKIRLCAVTVSINIAHLCAMVLGGSSYEVKAEYSKATSFVFSSGATMSAKCIMADVTNPQCSPSVSALSVAQHVHRIVVARSVAESTVAPSA